MKRWADARWRADFVPHAVILTERSIPTQITMAALFGIRRLRRIDFDLSQPPVTFIQQALAALPERLHLSGGQRIAPFFGKPLGVIVNLTPDRAIAYDLDANPIDVLDHAYRIGEGQISISGRPVPASLFGGGG